MAKFDITLRKNVNRLMAGTLHIFHKMLKHSNLMTLSVKAITTDP